jgi:RNA polymerase primary sigma factor
MVEILNKLTRIQQKMLQETGLQLKPQELAERILLSEERFSNALEVPKEPISMETPMFESEEAPTIGDFLKDERVQSPLDAATSAGLKEAVERILSELKPREAQILRMRFGIGKDRDHTLEAVGIQFNVTRERIRQIEAKALRKLRKLEAVTALQSFLEEGAVEKS